MLTFKIVASSYILVPAKSEELVNIVNLYTVDLQKWLKDPKNIYIGRQTRFVAESKWKNPHIMDDPSSRDKVIKQFEEYFMENSALRDSVGELKGKVLGCWCSPQRCHGEFLHRMAGNKPVYQSTSH